EARRGEARHDQAADAEAHGERSDPRCEQGNERAPREDRQAGLERRPAAQLLHVERRDELEAEPAADEPTRAEGGLDERGRAEDAEAYERDGHATLDRRERGQERR